MVSGPWITLLFLSAAVLAAAKCPHGQFHSEKLQTCLNCTICDREKGLVVLRPCEVHRDVVCASVDELFEYINPRSGNHHHRHNRKHHRKEKENEGGNVEPDNSTKRLTESTESEQHLVESVTSTQVPFSNAETLVWDWQAISLTLAVFACILFFLVIALYSLHQAKQWRRLKENFEAGEYYVEIHFLVF